MKDVDVLTLLVDYAPLLQSQQQALVIYMYYDAMKDENGRIKPSYKELKEHLGLAYTTISRAIKLLQEVGLLQPQQFGEDEPPRPPSYYEVLPLVPFSKASRAEKFKKAEHRVLSKLRIDLLAPKKLPLEYQQLFSKKDLRRALKKLGRDQFTFREIAKFFRLDDNVIRLWASNPEFKKKFIRCKEVILNEKVTLREQKQKGKRKAQSPDEVYESLMKAHLSRKTQEEIPRSDWKAAQLLRYFCILYERKNKCKYVLLSFSSKELKDMGRLLEVFRGKSESAIKYLDWVFTHKDKVLPGGVLATGICLHPRMLNEFAKTNTKTTFYQTDPIDEDFIAWIRKNVSEYAEDVKFMRDLYWLKDEYDNDEQSEQIKTIVEEGIRRGIIPAKGNIAFK